MKKKLLLIFSFIGFVSFSQNKKLDSLLLKGFSSKDSTYYYFKKASLLIKTPTDSANYYYYKFFKKDVLKENDSANYFAKKAIPLLEKTTSLEKSRKIHERLYFQYLRAGQYDLGLKEIQTALQYAKKLKDTSKISLHYSDISILYHDYEFFKKGIIYGKKSFHIMHVAKNKDYKYLIYANNAIAINFDDWNKPDSALFYHYKNLKYLPKVKDSVQFGFIFNNIANTLLKAKKYSKAKVFLKRSLALNKLRGRDYNLTTNYTNLATIAFKEGKNKEALAYFKKAHFHAKRAKSIEKTRDILEQEFRFYKKRKNYQKALEKKEAYIILRDSVFNKDRAKTIAKLEVEFETAKKEKEIAQQKEELLAKELKLKNRNLYAILLTASLLILGILSFGFYKKNQFKRKQLQKELDLKEALSQIKTQNRLQEQRLRISRDLHDNIGSQLTFIISSIDNLKHYSKDINLALKEKLTAISTFTSDTIFQLRDTIWAMNRNQITSDDLHARILSYIEKAQTANPTIQFKVDHAVTTLLTFTSVEGAHLFRVMQEAINNAIKYADASNISIFASIKNNELIIEIKDNGKGFDITKVTLGNGLSNMEKRVQEIGGKIFIHSDKKGTSIKIIKPLKNT